MQLLRTLIIDRPEYFLNAFRAFLQSQQLDQATIRQTIADIRAFVHAIPSIARDGAAHAYSLDSDEELILDYLATLEHTERDAVRRSFAFLQDFVNTSRLQSSSQHDLVEGNSVFNQELLDAYAKRLEEKGVKEGSIKNYLSDIRAYLHFTDTLPLEKSLTPETLTQYHTYLGERGTSASTIARKTSVIKQFTTWAHHAGRLESDPFAVVAPLTIPFELLPGLRSRTPSPADDSDPTPTDRYEEDHASAQQTRYSLLRSQLARWYTRYHLWPASSYLHLAILVCLSIFISLLGFEQFYSSTSRSLAYPTALTPPSRILSFQARLTNASQTPITTSTNLEFSLHTLSSGGTELWNSSTCSITPDQNGIFSTLLGSTCGGAIASSVFTENSEVWLQVKVGSETLTPRQRIATVAYALNSETLQGYPPADPATINTIPVVNNSGQIIIAASSPLLQSTTGTFGIKADALSITTDTGTNGDITLAPDGTGQVNLVGSTTTQDFIDITNANLTTGSLVKGTVGNDNTGYKFLSFMGGSTPAEKFFIDALGNTNQTGYLRAPGATISATYSGATPLIVNGTGGQIFSIANNGNITGAGTLTGLTGLTSSGTITLSAFTSNGGLLYTNGSGVVAQTAVGSLNECLLSAGGGSPTWGSCAGAVASSIHWTSANGSLFAKNSTLDLLVGGQASTSATFAILNNNLARGNQVASLSGSLVLDAAGSIQTTSNQALTIGGDKTGTITFKPNNATVFTVGALGVTNAGTLSSTGGIVSLNASSNFAVNIGTGTTTSAVTLGGGSNDVIIDSDTWDVSSGGAVTGLTGITSSGTITFSGLNTNGGLVYANGSGVLAQTAAGTAGQCLNGGTTPSWVTCTSIGSNWRVSSGAISPNNDTLDLLVGSNASTSAKFAVLNVNAARGNQTASVSGNLTLDAAGSIQTTSNQALTIGGDATGTITLKPNNATVLTVGALGTTNAGALSSTGGIVSLNASSNFAVNIGTGTTTSAVTLGGGSNDVIIDSDTWDVSSLGAVTGLTGITSSGTITFSGLNTAGAVVYTNGSGTLGVSAAGSAGECLKSGGTGSPTWGSCAAGAGSSNWRIASGAISPINDTLDLLIGADATTSAKFAIIGVNNTRGNQTASVSGNLVLDAAGSIQTTNNQALTIGGNTTGNITLSPLNATGTVAVSGALTVSGQTNLNGIFVLGDNGDVGSIDTNDWDITTAGNMSGIGTISSNGDWTNSQATPTINLTDSTAASDDYTINVEANAFDITNGTDTRVELQFVGDGSINFGDNTATKTIDIGGVTASAIDTINIGTEATAADVITIGNTNASTTLALVGGDDWSISAVGALDINGLFTLGDGGDTGAIDTSSWDISSAGAASGFTGITSSGTITFSGLNTAGAVVYTNGSGVLGVSAAGNSGECLVSGGTGSPTWSSCSLAAANNFWRISSGAISPYNDTLDFLVGANASTSATFAILNNNLARGNQVASLSGSLVLDAASSIQTTKNQLLTIGGNTTGNIALMPLNGSGYVGIGTTSPAYKLHVSQGAGLGTGVMRFAHGDDGGQTLDISYDGTTNDWIHNTSATRNYRFDINNTTSLYLQNGGNVGIGGDLTPDAMLSVGATSQFQVNSSGAIAAATGITSSGTITFSGLNTAGAVVYTNGSGVLGVSAAGSSGECLKSGGTGSPTWSACSSGSTSNWRIASGAISPINDTLDLLIGSSASTSATFAILNNNLARGNQVASLSGSLVLDAASSIQTTNRQLLTLGGSTTGNITIQPVTGWGNVGIGTTAPLGKFHVSGVNGGNALAIFDDLNSNDILTASASGTTRMRLDTNGYLYAQRFTDIADSTYYLDPAATSVSLNIAGSASTSATLAFRGTTDPKIDILNGENFGIRTSPGGDAGLVERLTVLAGGQVGIGTTSPLVALDVRGLSGTTGVASVSGQTSSAVFSIDNAGVGDLLTASVSGGIRAVLEGDGDYKIAGIFSALSSYVTKLGASGSTAGTTANNNILFVDSSGTTKGRFETTSSTTYSTVAGDGSDGSVTITGTKSLNTSTIASSRSYADGIAYKIDPATATDSGTTVKLYDAPDGIAAGDEVLLINLQGASGDTTDVGNYEFMKISSINTTTREVTFSSAITKSYNGTTPSNQKIVIQRIPQYTTVFVDGTLTATAWDGLATIPTGAAGYYTGIVAFRASKSVNISGTVTSSGLGYRGGSGSTDRTTNSGGAGGESFDGTLAQSGADANSNNEASGGGKRGDGATASPANGAARGGGGGGGAAGSASSSGGGGGGAGGGYAGGGGGGGSGGFSGSSDGGAGGTGGSTGTNAGGGAGSQTSGTGVAGGNAGSAGTSATGTGGAAGSGATGGSGGGGGNLTTASGAGAGGGGVYGDSALSDMFFGSGGGGGGQGDSTTSADAGGAGGAGGGIIFIGTTTLTSLGVISSNGSTGGTGGGGSTGADGGGGGGGAGGSVYIAATSASLGGGPTASGGSVGSSLDGGGGGAGGIGRMRVEAASSTNVNTDASTSTSLSSGVLSATDEPTSESVGNLYIAGSYSALSGSNTSIKASGSTSGNSNDGSIYFLDSNSVTRGRVDTTLPASPYGDGADGSITVSSTFNINTTNLASGRTYADGIAYRVNAPTTGDTSVSRYSGSDTISNGIAAGDEVMLINLQGTSGDAADVGNYEFFRVTAASASTITFDRPIARSYAGESASNQKVVIQRIPNYITVTMTAAITAANWDGLTTTPTGAAGYYTGIIAFRAQSLVNSAGNTAVWADGLGYRGGAGGNSSVAYGGESYDGSIYGYGGLSQSNGPSGGGGVEGDGSAGTDSQGIRGGGGGGGSTGSTSAANNGGGGGAGGGYGGGGGGGGGGGDGAGAGGSGGRGGDTGVGGGGGGGNRNGTAAGGAGGDAGHIGSTASGTGGDPGTGSYTGWGGDGSGSGVASTISGAGGGGGGLYGDPDLSKMFHGSGGGGGGYAQAGGGAGGAGGDGGGIVFVAAKTIYWNSTDSIRSVGLAGSTAATNGGMGGGGAGGSVYIVVESNTLNPGYLAYAPGGAGAAVSGETGGGGSGGVGRVKIEGSTINVSTTPLASYQPTYSPWILTPQSTTVSAYGILHIGSVNTSNADLAEYYVTGDRDVSPGDVVMFSDTKLLASGGQEVSNKGVLRKADRGYHPKLAGIISTAPGLVLGSVDGETGEADKRQLALSGRVPIKIDPDSEPIAIGDFLTSSEKPGFAKKATQAGYTVAKALETWTPGSGVGKIESFVTLGYTDPDRELDSVENLMGYIDLIPDATHSAEASDSATLTGTFSLFTKAGTLIQKSLTASRAVIANLWVGSLSAKKIDVERLTVAGQSLEDYIGHVASSSALFSEDLMVRVKTATESGVPDTFTVTNSDHIDVFAVNTLGEATISGSLDVPSIQTENLLVRDATITGTLYADKIAGLEEYLRAQGLVATPSAQPAAELVQTLPLETQALIDQMQSEISSWRDQLASTSATIDTDAVFIDDYLGVSGLANFSQASVAGELSVSNRLRITGNAISLVNPIDTLYVQPLGTGSLDLLAGAMTLSTSGGLVVNTDALFAGNVTIQENLMVSNIYSPYGDLTFKLASGSANSKIAVLNGQDEEVASITASGAATFKKLIIAGDNVGNTQTQDGQASPNASTGTALLPAGTTTITIQSSSVTPDSLVYVTPTSSTNNQVLYVATKIAENPDTPQTEGAFMIKLDTPLPQDVTFNWWVIN